MGLASKLTIPALIGGLVALAAMGVFSPQVQASWFRVDAVAQVTGVPADRVLTVFAAPDAKAERVGVIARNAYVWVENCVGADSDTGWCAVERSGTRGWVSARYLTPSGI